jgi:anti-anti-sigma regulatory factor
MQFSASIGTRVSVTNGPSFPRPSTRAAPVRVRANAIVEAEVLHARVVVRGGAMTIEARGALHGATIRILEQALRDALELEPVTVTLDLREVGFVDVVGARELAAALAECVGGGVPVDVVTGAALRRLFELIGRPLVSALY